MKTRKYLFDECPKEGDVIQLFEGSYGTGIITRVNKKDWNPVSVEVERVHASFSFGQSSFGIERLTISMDSLRKSYPAYVTGHSGLIENRDRTP